jgi:hypothetical protein
MTPSGSRPRSFESLRGVPVIGRVMDWGMGPSAASERTRRAEARIAGMKVTESVCPFCAVGCGQLVYTRAGELVDIEGNPRSPINQGTLCPKGASSRQLVQQPGRLTNGSLPGKRPPRTPLPWRPWAVAGGHCTTCVSGRGHQGLRRWTVRNCPCRGRREEPTAKPSDAPASRSSGGDGTADALG